MEKETAREYARKEEEAKAAESSADVLKEDGQAAYARDDGAQPVAEKKAKSRAKEFFSAKKIAVVAVMTALAFVVSLFDFPLFPQASFLKLDFGNVFIMLAGFLYGPVEGFIACVIKELIRIPMGTTGGVGELANICMTTAFIVVPSTVYKFRRRFFVVIPSLIFGIVLQIAASLVCNRYITFPLFMGGGAAAAFKSLWPFIIYFNLAKGAIISVICCLMYKTVSRLVKTVGTGEKREKPKKHKENN